MGGLKKTVRKVSHKAMQVTSPVGYNVFGKKVFSAAEGYADQNIYGPDPVQPEVPATVTPTVMPTPDDADLAKSRKKRIAAQRARSGRLSTVLTDSDALGG